MEKPTMMPAPTTSITSSTPLTELKQRLAINKTLAKEVRKKLALMHPLNFGLIYLPHYLINKVAPFHLTITRPENLEASLLAIAAPREHAKSTLVNIIITLWEYCSKLIRYQIYVGDTSDNAQASLAALTYELETNELLINDFGPFKDEDPRKWSDRAIITLDNVKFEAMGVGTKLRGKKHLQWRPNRILCDDIENDENVATKEQRDKLYRWFFSALLNARSKVEGKIRVIGTILHYDSLLANIINTDKNEGWVKHIFRAVNYDPAGNPYSLWPDQWSIADLAVRKAQVGSVIFQQEMQNEPIDETTAIIKRSWIKYHDGYTPDQAKEWKKIIRIDPSIKKGEQNDEFAMAVLGTAPDHKMKLLDTFKGKISLREQVSTVFQYALRWSAGTPGNVEIHVEDNAYQDALKQLIEEMSREQKQYWNVKGVSTVSDKTTRVKAVSGVIEGGHIEFGLEQTDAVEQLVNFGKMRYDDLADAVVGAIEGARTSTPGFLGMIEQEAEAARKDPAKSFIQTWGQTLRNQ